MQARMKNPAVTVPGAMQAMLALGSAGTSAAEGVAVDAAGNVYGAEVGPKAVKRYVKRSGT